MAPKTTAALRKNFNSLYPECMIHLPNLRFVEQYDPNDLSASGVSQPYAYVADLVEEVKLGVEIDEVRGRGLNNDQWTSIMELRDKLAPEENVGWYIVVCGDEERLPPPPSASGEEGANSREITPSPPADAPAVERANGGSTKLQKKQGSPPDAESKGPSGLKKLLGSTRLGRRKR